MLAYVFGLLPIVLGLLVGWLSVGDTKSDWYTNLKKPAWTPPSAVFGPVWSVLYVLIGVSSIPVFKAWQGGVPGAGVALCVFVVSLALNLSWTPLFFKFQRPDMAFICILALLLSIIVMMILFGNLTRLWWLLVPYVVWVTYATTLNAAILYQNKA